MIRHTISIFIFTLMLGLLPATVSAQGLQNITHGRDLIDQGMSIHFSPAYPTAFEEVTVRISSSRHDLGAATITWAHNDVVVKSGYGERTATFTTGANGTSATISFLVETVGGARVYKEITLRPTIVNLQWEANTYTPPLYRGRALATPEAVVRIIASPEFIRGDGSVVPPESLIYRWKQSSKQLTDDSGIGKRTLELKLSRLQRELSVSVEVLTQDGSLQGLQTITIPVKEPLVRIYEFHPLSGIRYATDLHSAFTLNQDEVVLISEPYFFPVVTRDAPEIAYTWKLAGAPVNARSMITLRREAEELITSALSVRAQHNSYILQGGEQTIQISY